MLREKILAYNSREFIVIVDESKLVNRLGKFTLPVEIVPFAATLTLQQLTALGCTAGIRQTNGKDFITDNGNLIADCPFAEIAYQESLNARIKAIPGVVESGLFSALKVGKLIVGSADGNVRILQQATAKD